MPKLDETCPGGLQGCLCCERAEKLYEAAKAWSVEARNKILNPESASHNLIALELRLLRIVDELDG